jgi:hypothetical protein
MPLDSSPVISIFDLKNNYFYHEKANTYVCRPPGPSKLARGALFIVYFRRTGFIFMAEDR